jgi:hypothetical protein
MSDLQDHQTDTAESPGEPEGEGRPNVFSQVLIIAGIACLPLGALWTWQNWSTARGLVAASAEFVGSTRRPVLSRLPTGRDLPLMTERRSHYTYRNRYDYEYRYVVEGTEHRAVVEGALHAPPHRVIYYDPNRPADYVLDVPPVWWPLLLTITGGLFCFLVAYAFR